MCKYFRKKLYLIEDKLKNSRNAYTVLRQFEQLTPWYAYMNHLPSRMTNEMSSTFVCKPKQLGQRASRQHCFDGVSVRVCV